MEGLVAEVVGGMVVSVEGVGEVISFQGVDLGLVGLEHLALMIGSIVWVDVVELDEARDGAGLRIGEMVLIEAEGEIIARAQIWYGHGVVTAGAGAGAEAGVGVGVGVGQGAGAVAGAGAGREDDLVATAVALAVAEAEAAAPVMRGLHGPGFQASMLHLSQT